MKKTAYVILILSILVSACNQPVGDKSAEKKADEKVIGKPDVQLASDVMTPEVLWYFGRVGGVEVSPDFSRIVYGITYYDIDDNKGNTDLYMSDIDGQNVKQLTNTPKGEYSSVWFDNDQIAYMSTESGDMQLWLMNVATGDKKQASKIDGGISGFKFSPDKSKLMYTKDVKIDKDIHDLYPDLPKANAYIETDLMYRHWDRWHDYTYSHVFVADFTNENINNDKDIMEGQRFHSPLKPWGGTEQINWSPDSKKVAYTCKHSFGKEYSLSTNSDIFIYDLESGETSNLTEGMMGYDVAPVYSPDGAMIAWESMERDGYEADKNRLFIYDIASGTKKDYSADFDRNAHGLSWSADSKTIWFTCDNLARYQVYSLDLASGIFKQVTQGNQNYQSVVEAGDKLIGTKQSMSMPTEIFSIDPATGAETQLTFINKPVLDQLKLANVEERWVKTTDNKDMLVWVIYPPHFDPNKKYPALLYCQGGPQSSVSQFFSYRWNFQMMAANGYIIVAPNRRGLPSFGQEWNEQISGDYSGQNMKDYLTAIDELSKEPFIDENNLGGIGASYGGFSVYWLAGNHDGRFKAFISHDGMFNLEAQYLETEEMFFVNWDLGGPFWDKSNAVAQRSYANSPHKYIEKWDTPILIIHGEQDFRITYTQGMSAFNAAVLRGVPAKFLYFPEENHWVLKPQNSILWQRTFKDWLDQWLKE
ncbi:MAG: S9 family peptidase [Bacteroidales bacterium]|nr:S9 family peptidase [Bacteroidales bacterium]MCF8458013.1 S9 family peptidase [Bacteroidales bacterium]